MLLTTAARAETSPPVVNVHFGSRVLTVAVEILAELLAVFATFCPNIGQSWAASGATAKIVSATVHAIAATPRDAEILFMVSVPHKDDLERK